MGPAYILNMAKIYIFTILLILLSLSANAYIFYEDFETNITGRAYPLNKCTLQANFNQFDKEFFNSSSNIQTLNTGNKLLCVINSTSSIFQTINSSDLAAPVLNGTLSAYFYNTPGIVMPILKNQSVVSFNLLTTIEFSHQQNKRSVLVFYSDNGKSVAIPFGTETAGNTYGIGDKFCENMSLWYGQNRNKVYNYTLKNLINICNPYDDPNNITIDDFQNLKYFRIISEGDAILDNIKIYNISETKNSLPNFTVSYQKNVCINASTSENNFNFTFTCADPDGDTCYYSAVRSQASEQILKLSFDKGLMIQTVPTPYDWLNTLGGNILKGVLGTVQLTGLSATLGFLGLGPSVVPDGIIYNDLVNADASAFDNGLISSDCTLDSGDISLSKFSEYPALSNMLSSNGCLYPINVTIPAYTKTAQANIYTADFLFINQTNFSGYDFANGLIWLRDGQKNLVINLSMSRNFTTQNTTIKFNSVTVYANTTPINMYSMAIFTDVVNNTFFYVISGYVNQGLNTTTLYVSPEYPMTWNNLKYVTLWTYSGKPMAFDNIAVYGVLDAFAWTTVMPISSASIPIGYSAYNLYVTDSYHKDSGQYDIYPISVSVSSKYCGAGLYDAAHPPETAEERGSPKGFFYLLSLIYGIGNNFGAQQYFNAVGWLFYLIIGSMVFFSTRSLDWSLIMSSVIVFILSITGMLGVAYMATSIILLSFGIAMRVWFNPESGGG